jgi:hypothetical protein
VPDTEKLKRLVVIDCKAPLWRNALKTNLQERRQINLRNIDYTVDGAFCELLAFSHRMIFSLDAKNASGSFRKRVEK